MFAVMFVAPQWISKHPVIHSTHTQLSSPPKINVGKPCECTSAMLTITRLVVLCFVCVCLNNFNNKGISSTAFLLERYFLWFLAFHNTCPSLSKTIIILRSIEFKILKNSD